MSRFLQFIRADRMNSRSRMWIVWALRIIIGVTFIVSGISKCIDIWGFSFKIGEYMIAWGLDVPHALCVMAAIGLSVAEFVLGAMLMLGCYKRSSAWLLLAMMCGMLPLSLYIFIASPVADCGCFGDFWVISNGATFVKNIFLTAALIFLAFANSSVAGLFRPYSQWVVATACAIYAIVISLWGYNVQPLVDFRSFPVGFQLASAEEEADNTEVAFEFIYEKEGVTQKFSADSLPDSTWTFVDRKPIGDVRPLSETELTVYEQGEDVTEEVISTEGPQLIVVVPDFSRAGIANTYALNELHHILDSIGGTMFEVAAIPDDAIERWRDLSMAEYPIYQAESTVLKELARGVMSAVFLRDGRIIWKRTVPSIDIDSVVTARDKNAALDSLAIDSGRLFRLWTGLLASVLALIWFIGFLVGIIRTRSSEVRPAEKDEKKDDGLQKNK